MIIVGAVDDHPLVLRGLAATLVSDPGVRLVASAPTVAELLAAWVTPLNVVLLDVHLDDGSDVQDNVVHLRERGANVLLVTSDHRPAIVGRALDAGALGLVLKEDPEESLLESVRAVAQGEFAVSSRLAHQVVTDPLRRVRLSRKELDVLGLLARGLPWTQIAREVGTSTETARTYCYRVVEKYAQRHGRRQRPTGGGLPGAPRRAPGPRAGE